MTARVIYCSVILALLRNFSYLPLREVKEAPSFHRRRSFFQERLSSFHSFFPLFSQRPFPLSRTIAMIFLCQPFPCRVRKGAFFFRSASLSRTLPSLFSAPLPAIFSRSPPRPFHPTRSVVVPTGFFFSPLITPPPARLSREDAFRSKGVLFPPAAETSHLFVVSPSSAFRRAGRRFFLSRMSARDQVGMNSLRNVEGASAMRLFSQVPFPADIERFAILERVKLMLSRQIPMFFSIERLCSFPFAMGQGVFLCRSFFLFFVFFFFCWVRLLPFPRLLAVSIFAVPVLAIFFLGRVASVPTFFLEPRARTRLPPIPSFCSFPLSALFTFFLLFSPSLVCGTTSTPRGDQGRHSFFER